LPRQRAPGILLSLGWSHPGAFNRVAGKTRRFSRNRCARKRIGQFPAFDAYLLNNLWHPMSGADRIRFAGDPARSQRRLCHHRLHPRERRKFLSLSAHDPFSELENCVLIAARVNAFESCPAHRRRLPRRELLNSSRCNIGLDASCWAAQPVPKIATARNKQYRSRTEYFALV
jgi:hypothetical protein